MAGQHSYTITVDNNRTEKEAVDYLLSTDIHFINPSKESRKVIMEKLGLEKGFARAFDLIIVKGHTNNEHLIDIQNPKDITLVELKTTKKKLVNNPKGFFFGATKNEFDLAERLGDQFRFCFVSLHPESKSYALLTLPELRSLIKTERVQYQINLG